MTAKQSSEQDNTVPVDKFLSEAQLKQLLQYVSDEADSARQRGAFRAVIDELIIFLLAEAGLRPAEFCNLNIEDLPSKQGRNTLIVRDSAGNLNREVEISSKAAELADRFIQVYRCDVKSGDPLFISERGNRFTYRSLYNKVKTIGINAGIGPLYPHMLRSTFIVHLFNKVKDLRLVQQQAGHASPKTTAFYTRGDLNKKRKRANPRKKAPLPIVELRNSPEHKNTAARCDVCERLLDGEGRKIDSGQFLCGDCLKYFQ
jgi:integrase